MTDAELTKRLQRMENQIAALRHSNLVLLQFLGMVAQGQQLSAGQIETLRGQYRAVTSLAIPNPKN